MTTDQSIKLDEEAPLLYVARGREHVPQTPFPWFQFSILFALQTATYMSYYATYPFVPDVRSYCFENHCPKALLSVDSKSRDSKGREGRGTLCRVAGTCPSRG